MTLTLVQRLGDGAGSPLCVILNEVDGEVRVVVGDDLRSHPGGPLCNLHRPGGNVRLPRQQVGRIVDVALTIFVEY